MMTPDLFLDCIFLLINDNSPRHQTAVKELIQVFEEESKQTSTVDDDLVRFYIQVLQRILADSIDRADRQQMLAILLTFKSNPAVEKRRDVFDLLTEAFTSRDAMSGDQLDKLAKRVQQALIWHRTTKITKSMFGRLHRCADMVDPVAQEAELTAILRHATDLQAVFHKASAQAGAAGMVDTISFVDRASISAALSKFEERNVRGVIKMGLQGLNRMLGRALGIVRGESVVFNALPHMYKSGLLTSAAMWAVAYNNPLVEDGKKPLVYLASLENEAYQNLMNMFRQRYLMETGQPAEGLSNEQIEDWLYAYFQKRGFNLVIERHLPSNFGYDEFVSRIQHYEGMGYVVYLAIVDYLNLAKKGASDPKASNAARDLAVRDLFSRFCNFTKSKGIAFVTAHPLNRKAQELAGSFKDVVKRFSAEHLADSMDVQREVDVSIFVHLETNQEGQKYLTMRIDKHRYVDDTPEAHKYCAYPFTRWGIMDDLLTMPGFVRDIFAHSFDSDGVVVANDPEAADPAAAVF